MIKRYTDHAANERTYLAWIRTAVSIMALGFLIEKFDLMITSFGGKINSQEDLIFSLSAEAIGLGLFCVGLLIIVKATLRFFIYRESIESEGIVHYNLKNANLLLSLMMVMVAVFLFVYIGHLIIN